MEIVTWSPFKAITRAEGHLSELLGDDWWEIEMPATDMYEEDGKLIVETNLPNFKDDEIEINSTGTELEIKAQHKTNPRERNYYLRESSNSYWRRVRFPEGIKVGKPVSKFAGGVLTATMLIETYV